MMNMRGLALGIVTFGALGTFGAAAPAQAMPVAALQNGAAGTAVVDVRYRKRHPRRYVYRDDRPRLYVSPGGYGPTPAQMYYGTSRGFEDPGYAYHGNLSGCATDLGYGRWESCDQ